MSVYPLRVTYWQADGFIWRDAKVFPGGSLMINLISSGDRTEWWWKKSVAGEAKWIGPMSRDEAQAQAVADLRERVAAAKERERLAGIAAVLDGGLE